jgi:hypothetical protein
MPARPDLRHLTSGVRDAFADCDRDTLLEILTAVVKEYVVEGPPPMLVHQVEELTDLRGLSFAQLVTTLQQRLEQPELALFAVDGETVSVRVGGAMHPLTGGRTPLTPAADLPRPAADLPRPAAGVRVVEAGVVQAPRPTAGLSVRGQATPTPSAAPTPPSSAPAPSPAPAAADKPADKPAATGGDDAAARFSLLELD